MKPNLQIEYRSIDALLPYARNPRTHSPAQIAKISASIVEFGWTQPILVDGDNGIIAGHGRLAAARKLELAEVPVIEVHISNVHRRESFRHHSYVSLVAQSVLAGFGTHGYALAISHFARQLQGVQ